LLVRLRPSHKLLPVLREVLVDPAWSIRWNAVEALGRWKFLLNEELAEVLLSSVPSEPKFEEWLHATRSLSPLPPMLAAAQENIRSRRGV
jgi:hypothetical protein